MANIKFIPGDLFDSPDSLVQCVSADLRMSKGLARQFKLKFRQMRDLQPPFCKIGDLVVVPVSISIFNLVTKTRFFHKPSYRSMLMCLENLRRELVLLHLGCVSMPMIGSGLDSLDWSSVVAILHSVFSSTSVQISVYFLAQPCPRYFILTY